MLRIPTLDEAEISDFHRDGFVAVRGTFNEAEMRLIEGWTAALAERPEVPGRHWVYHEKSLKEPGADLINRIEKLSPFDEGFAELSAALRPAVGQLLGEEAVLFKEKINFKMPGGDGFKPHQDSQAGWEKYGDYYISVMVCVDEATLENGCLKMVAGHHKRGLFREWEPLTEEDMEGMEFVPCPTKPGDIVFFDSYAPHASEPNMSDNIRRLYFATYNRLSDGDRMDEYYADKHKSLPPDIDREAGKEYVYLV